MEQQLNTEQNVSYGEISRFVRNHKQMHQAMSKNGWRLPSFNSAICTLEFMDQVREGIIYAPKHSDVNSAI